VKYEKALDLGRLRARDAARALRRWTGVESMALCAVKAAPWPERWLPVGEQSYKEIALDEGYRRSGKYSLLVVDETGAVKACSRKLYALAEVLRLADRLPMPVAMPGRGELWRQIREEDRREDAREHGLHVEV